MQVDPDLIEDEAGDGSVFGVRSPARRRGRAGRQGFDALGAVALGGGLGSLARYGVEQVLPPRAGTFPWATFVVNIVGCLAIGILMVFVTEIWAPGRYARPFLGIGVLGGLTTFSTLALETRTLGSLHEWILTVGYVSSTLLGGLLAVSLGMVATRWVTRVDGRASR